MLTMVRILLAIIPKLDCVTAVDTILSILKVLEII